MDWDPSNNKQLSDDEIISILLSQDNEAARSALVQEIRIKFEKIARYKGVDIDDIDDVVHDGLEKLITKLPSFHGRGPLNNWATVLFGNHCTDYFRRRATQSRVVSHVPSRHRADGEDSRDFDCDIYPGSAPDPLKCAVDRERLDIVISAIDKVILETACLRRNPSRDVEIARLGLSALLEPREILEKLVCNYPTLSLNAVRIVLHEFRVCLRAEIEEVQKSSE